MKKEPKIRVSRDRWTKWFFPGLWIQTWYRDNFPHHRPSHPMEVERYIKRNNQLTLFYVLMAA